MSSARRLKRRRVGRRGAFPRLLEVEVYSLGEFTSLVRELNTVHARYCCAPCARAHINAAFVTHLGVGLVTYQPLSEAERTETIARIEEVHTRFCAFGERS